MFNKMDKAVLDDDNYNELYRIHTGHALFGSGSDSDSLDEPVLIDSKPPLYTFDELNANLVVIGATSNQNKSDLNESRTGGSRVLKNDQVVQKELKTLILHDTCLLCNVYNHDLENHKKGKTHRKNVEQYIKGRLEAFQNKKYAENSYCNGNIQNKQSLDLTKCEKENLLQCLADLNRRTYCYVCDTKLSTPVIANSHYNNSWRHTNNVQYWKGEFTSGLQQKPASHNVEPNYCFMCKAKLPGPEQVRSHLKSKGHRTNVTFWINDRNLTFQLKNKNSIKTLQTNQHITKTSTVQKTESICNVCGIKIGADYKKHSLIDEHKRNVKTFCFVCNIKTQSKQQLAEHVKGRRHKNNLSTQKFSSSLDIPGTTITPVRNEDTSNIDKILVHSNKSRLGVIEKSSIDNQTPASTINSAHKNENINSSQDIPNETYKEIKPAEAIIDKNKTRIVSPEFYNYTLMVDKISVHSNNSQLGVIEKSTIDNETPALTTNSADKNKNINSKDIPNETYKEIKPAETIIDKNKTSSVLQEFNYSDPSTSKEMVSYFSGTDKNGNTNSEKIPITSIRKNENINMTQYVADKVDKEIESEKSFIEENEGDKDPQYNEGNVSTKTVNITYSKKVVTTNSKYCQTEEMEEINNKCNSGNLVMEMEKFTNALKSVPLDIALLYLQNGTKKLQESMKNGNVLDIEVENRNENNVRNKKGKRKKKSVFKPFFHLNTEVSEVNSGQSKTNNVGQSEDLSKVPKSKTNNVGQSEDLSKVPKSKTNNLLSKGVTCPCALM